MEILHLKDFWDTESVITNAVINYICYVALDTLSLYHNLKQSDNYLWIYCILKIWGILEKF